jgi:molybdopterin-dependent oxidoreductase alpha subunit
MGVNRLDASGDIPADYDEHAVTVAPRKREAAGMRGVMVSLQRGFEQMGARRTAATLARLNQRKGFDCPGCAWPEERDGRKLVEFCENGVKAVAEEATKRAVTPEFFARHSVAELSAKPEHWLSQQGRLTHPMVLRPGDDHYRPISWDSAYRLIVEQLNALADPDQAVFYTSGRTSNEAAFCYQLLVRCFGTNNLPDCANMCHESSGWALTESIGIGKGSVSIDDVERADLIVIAGQNPGSNHPRMLSVLQKAKANGAKIIAVNPMPEAGLIRFKDPQKVNGLVGQGIPIADEFTQIRIGGDMALFAGLGRLLLEADERAPGTVIDQEFVDAHCAGFDEYRRRTTEIDFDTVYAASGIERQQLERMAAMLMASQRTVVCWAMGLTQHTHAVSTIAEITNLLLLRGMIGKPGAGVCPVRGHSNVQGDRTMGISDKMPEQFLASLDREFGVTSPRKRGYDTVAAIRAMRDGRATVFMGMGGNFASATPDTAVTEAALRSCALTVQVSTKLNRSHVVHGNTALILPTLGRTDRDIRGGRKQVVSVEDSMSMVHLSRGSLHPPSDQLRSEVEIICQLARRLLGVAHPVPWERFAADYDTIRDAIAAVVPGCTDYNRKVRQPDGFQLPHPPRDAREFHTGTGRANFVMNPLQWVPVPPGRLVLQTLRSHDQYNTTIYGLDDRYRGVKGGRRVVFINPADIESLGLTAGQRVDLVSEWTDADQRLQERRAKDFLVVAYSTPVGNAAAYYPEANALVPLDHTAAKSNTPASKAITIRVEPARVAAAPANCEMTSWDT